MKKCITDLDLSGKKVIIRVDFNVPIVDGVITDDNRIKESLKTIKYAIDNNAKVIIMSHLGRIKDEKDLEKNSLRVVALRLSELLFKPVKFVEQTRGALVEDAIANMKNKDVIMLENTRFEDINNLESGNDEELAKYWASLADIFIDDAFGLVHRAHASNVGIAKYLPNAIGFLIKKELDMLMPFTNDNKRPLTILLGGSKVKDKIGLINNFINKADYIIIGGGMAYTFLYVKGYNVGKSIVDMDNLEYVKKMLNEYGDKIILPLDSVVTKDIDIKEHTIKTLPFDNDDIGVDIGPKTIELFSKYIKDSNEVISNGPMGIFEKKEYSTGTKEILYALSNVSKVVIAGGDTASAAINMGFKDSFTHISTGGGASLAFLAGEHIPGIEVIDEK